MGLSQEIRDHKSRAFEMYDRPGLDDEVRLALHELYDQVEQLSETLETTENMTDYVAAYCSREAEKLKAHRRDDPHDHPYQGTRERELCSCDDRFCELKDGKLPRRIRRSGNPLREIQQFRYDHRGEPFVLVEAEDAYQGVRRRLKRLCRLIILCGRSNSLPQEVRAMRHEEDRQSTASAAELQEPNQDPERDPA